MIRYDKHIVEKRVSEQTLLIISCFIKLSPYTHFGVNIEHLIFKKDVILRVGNPWRFNPFPFSILIILKSASEISPFSIPCLIVRNFLKITVDWDC